MTGEELLNAVTGKGISIDYGEGLSDIAISSYWDSKALQFDSADAFLSDIGLSEGGTVTVNLNLSGNVIIGTVDSNNVTNITDASIFGESGGSVDCTEDGKTVNISVTSGPLSVVYYSAGYIENFNYPLSVVITKEDSSETKSLSAFGGGRIYGSITGGTVDVSVNSVEWFFAVNSTGTLCIFYRGKYVETQGVLSNPENWVSKNSSYPEDGSFAVYVTDIKPDLDSSKITFTWESGGGGGGHQTTLVFTATAGLPGRHCDPINGDTDANHPISRSEVPAYGSGGYGGHGGGGGAGASTVIIYKFDSGKADSVEQVAITKRHGYGSGGGAGGKGGDGCIIIFW